MVSQQASQQRPTPAGDPVPAGWSFLTNHAHTLVCLARNPDQTLREVANSIGVTERAVQRIVSDLEQAGVLTRHRLGRRNRYEIHTDVPMVNPGEDQCEVGDLLKVMLRD